MSLDITKYKKGFTTSLGASKSKTSQESKRWYEWLETFIQDIKQYGEDNYMSSTSPKRFKALLTQSGISTPTTQTSGSLVVGTTYEITDYNASDNFMNVGAPSNELGVKFIATGTTPAVWTESSELTYDTAAPTVIILENTIGNVWFEFSANDLFYLKSNALFTEDKTYYNLATTGAAITLKDTYLLVDSTSQISINSVNGLGAFTKCPIEIEVYS